MNVYFSRFYYLRDDPAFRRKDISSTTPSPSTSKKVPSSDASNVGDIVKISVMAGGTVFLNSVTLPVESLERKAG